MRSADIPGPHRRSQTILRIVGPAQRLLFISKRGDADDRAEDLALDDRIFLPGSRQQRRLVIVAVTGRLVATGDHLNMRQRAGGIDGGADPVQMCL